MTLAYALRDALGLKDLVEDTRATLRGEGINYRAFEPSEGGMHIGAARDRRIRAGLRYAAGGKRKYWLPDRDGDVTAPLFTADEDEAVYDVPDVSNRRGGAQMLEGGDPDAEDEDEYALTFSDALAGPEGSDEPLYEQAKEYVFGDYLYPVVDVSSEEARRATWEEEDRVVRDIVSGGVARTEGAFAGYGATQNGKRQARTYDDDPNDAHPDPHRAGPALFARTPQPPSSPRPRTLSVSPPITAISRSSSHQSHPHSPAQLSSRLHLPYLAPPSSSSASARSSPRLSVSKRAPLAEEDAVDLVVAVDSLQVPSMATGRGPHSPHSPVLIRVWEADSDSGPAPRQHEPAVEERVGGGVEQKGNVPEPDVQFVITMDDEETGAGAFKADEGDAMREEHDVVRAPTPPPHAGARGFGLGVPQEDDHNPWA